MEQDRFNRKVDPTVDHKAEFRRVEVIFGASIALVGRAGIASLEREFSEVVN